MADPVVYKKSFCKIEPQCGPEEAAEIVRDAELRKSLYRFAVPVYDDLLNSCQEELTSFSHEDHLFDGKEARKVSLASNIHDFRYFTTRGENSQIIRAELSRYNPPEEKNAFATLWLSIIYDKLLAHESRDKVKDLERKILASLAYACNSIHDLHHTDSGSEGPAEELRIF